MFVFVAFLMAYPIGYLNGYTSCAVFQGCTMVNTMTPLHVSWLHGVPRGVFVPWGLHVPYSMYPMALLVGKRCIPWFMSWDIPRRCLRLYAWEWGIPWCVSRSTPWLSHGNITPIEFSVTLEDFPPLHVPWHVPWGISATIRHMSCPMARTTKYTTAYIMVSYLKPRLRGVSRRALSPWTISWHVPY